MPHQAEPLLVNATTTAVTAATVSAAGDAPTPALWLLQARVLSHAGFAEAATATLTELALALGCERVSLGLLTNSLVAHGRIGVAASSGGGDPDPHQPLMQALAQAMDEALQHHGVLIFPTATGAHQPCAAHAALLQHNGQLPVCSVPVDCADGLAAVLLFERRAGFAADTLRQAQDAALFIGPLLVLKHQARAPLHQRMAHDLGLGMARTAGSGLGNLRLTPGRGMLLAALLVLLVVALRPVTFHVVAPARVEGVVQRVVAAPADGFVATVGARPGDAIKAGQLLLTLQDRDNQLQRERFAAEAAQADKQYRDALTRDDAVQIVIARSKFEQAQAQLDLAGLELERTRIRAPFDGVLIAGDLAQMVGQPVKRGQALMTLAPERSFKIVAEVDEQDVALLREGQAVSVVFAADGQAIAQVRIDRVAPVATVQDGRNVFEAEGPLAADSDGQGQGLRPGQRGVARITVDERLQAQVWWLRISNAWRRITWRFLG